MYILPLPSVPPQVGFPVGFPPATLAVTMYSSGVPLVVFRLREEVTDHLGALVAVSR